MLVTDGVLLWSPVDGAFAPLLLALASLVAVAGIAHRLGGRRAAVVAGGVFWVQPFSAWQATSTFVEPALTLAIALELWNLAVFARGAAAAARS